MRHLSTSEFVTTAEVRQRLKLRSSQTIWRYLRQGLLRGKKFGKRWLIDPLSVDERLRS